MAGGDRPFDLKNVLKNHLNTDRTPQKTQDILARLAEFDTHLPNGRTTVGRDTEFWDSYDEGTAIELERDIRLESGEKLSFAWELKNVDTESDEFVLFAFSLKLAIKDRDNNIEKELISFYYKKGAWHQKSRVTAQRTSTRRRHAMTMRSSTSAAPRSCISKNVSPKTRSTSSKHS